MLRGAMLLNDWGWGARLPVVRRASHNRSRSATRQEAFRAFSLSSLLDMIALTLRDIRRTCSCRGCGPLAFFGLHKKRSSLSSPPAITQLICPFVRQGAKSITDGNGSQKRNWACASTVSRRGYARKLLLARRPNRLLAHYSSKEKDRFGPRATSPQMRFGRSWRAKKTIR